MEQAAGDQALQPAPQSSSPPPPAAPAPASSPTPVSEAAPALALEAEEELACDPEENGEELEPLRNGAGHPWETESSDSGATPGDKEGPLGGSPELFQEGEEDAGLIAIMGYGPFWTGWNDMESIVTLKENLTFVGCAPLFPPISPLPPPRTGCGISSSGCPRGAAVIRGERKSH